MPSRPLSEQAGRHNDMPVPTYTHTKNGRTWRLYGCAKRGCDAVSPDYLSFDAGDVGYCLHHIPQRYRLKLWWQERRS